MGVFSAVPLNPSGFHELLDRKGYKAVRVGFWDFLSLLAVQSISATCKKLLHCLPCERNGSFCLLKMGYALEEYPEETEINF